jgi:hypothetical protein
MSPQTAEKRAALRLLNERVVPVRPCFIRLYGVYGGLLLSYCLQHLDGTNRVNPEAYSNGPGALGIGDHWQEAVNALDSARVLWLDPMPPYEAVVFDPDKLAQDLVRLEQEDAA